MTLNDVVSYANNRRAALIELCADLTQEELNRPLGADKRTIGNRIRHTLHTERWLLRSVVFIDTPKKPNPDRMDALPELLFALKQVRMETENFLTDLTDQDLQKTYPWPHEKGQAPPDNPVSLHWLLYHIEEQNTRRAGQLALLKRMVRKTLTISCEQ
jgi:uncharacterized damage-inducible protein DinB